MTLALVSVWNVALSKIAAGASIQDPNEASIEALECRLRWPSIRDATLRSFDWAFARRRQDLAKLGDADTGGRLGYRYGLPTDFLKVLGINERWDYSWVPQNLRPRYELGSELTAGTESLVLLSNDSPARLVYTGRVENPELYDATFYEVVTWALAAALAIPITKSIEWARVAKQEAALALDQAKTQAANERGAVVDAQPDWMQARGGEMAEGWSGSV